MRKTCLGLALALLATSVSAQDKQDKTSAATPSSTSVLVNGQSVRGNVLEIDGKHYVAVEDLAQSLRGTIAYSEGQIALTLSQLSALPATPPAPQPPAVASRPAPPQVTPMAAPPPAPPASSIAAPPPVSQPPAVAAQAQGTGRIQGTLTYFFSFHVGNKPDNGSKVWLVNDRAELPIDQNFVGSATSVGTSGNPQQYTAIQYSIAAENGNFQMLDVPAGEYTLILQSAHTKGALKEKRNIFGRGKPDLRDSNGRIEFLYVVVKPGETADGSKDFGPDAGA